LIVRDGRTDCPRDIAALERANAERTITSEVYALRQPLLHQLCANRGVYTWTDGKYSQRGDAIVQAAQAVGGKTKDGSLPGPCVDPGAHIRIMLRASGHSSFANETDAQSGLLDLDGDKQYDRAVLDSVLRQENSRQSPHHLYVMRGECGHYVGDVVGMLGLETLAQKSHSLHDLRIYSDHCSVYGTKSDPSRLCQATWRFDGTRYVRFGERAVNR